MECRKPKKVKKDKGYLDLEAKNEALLKKQKGKSYITEEKVGIIVMKRSQKNIVILP